MVFDEHGNPIPGEYLDDSTLSRGADGTMMAPGGPNDSQYRSEDDLLQERGYDATTGQMTDLAMTIDRRENGGMVLPPNEYEDYEGLQSKLQQQVGSAAR